MFLAEADPNRTQAQLGSRSPARPEPTSGACTGSHPFRLYSSPVIDASPAAPRYPDPHFSANLSGMRTYEIDGANSRRMRTYETKELNPFRMRTYKMHPSGVPSVGAAQSLLQSTSPLESHSCTNRLLNRPGLILLTLKLGGRGALPQKGCQQDALFAGHKVHLTCQTFSCDPSSLPHLNGSNRSLNHAYVR